MRMRSLAVLGLLLGGLASCGDGGEERTYQLDWGSFVVAAGLEGTRCVTLNLGNSGAVKINQIRNVLGPGASELIVYAVDSATVNDTPTPCVPFIDGDDPQGARPLFISRVSGQTLKLPDGVAFNLEANQKIRLQLRYFNQEMLPVLATARTELSTVAADEVEHEAGLLVAGNVDIAIPSNGLTFQAGPESITYPLALGGASVFAMTGLTNRLGTEFRAGFMSGGVTTTLYEPLPYSPSTPQITMIEPGAVLPAGGAFRLTCAYSNLTGNVVTFGFSTDQEHCFVAVYYYPRQAETVLIN